MTVLNAHARRVPAFPPAAGMRRLGMAAALLAVALAGCSAPATRVILLPEAQGASSAVVVRTQAGETRLDQPYQRATAVAGATSVPATDMADADQIRRKNALLFELKPEAAVSFTVYFEAGQSTLTPASQQAMAEVLAIARARSGGDIVITGYTDTLGAGSANDQLSLQRARLVRQMLVEQDFPSNRIEVAGRGERELAVPTPDETDEPRNRRVVIVVR